MNSTVPLPGQDWAIAFHGSATAFQTFSEDASIGKGFEANSELGVHLAHSAATAAHYAQLAAEDAPCGESAETTPIVYIVAYRQGRRHDASHEEFFCEPLGEAFDDPAHPLYAHDPERDDARSLARSYRQHLLEQGIVTLEREDVEDLGAHIIVLRPEDTVVLDFLAGAEAMEKLVSLDAVLRSDISLTDEARLERLRGLSTSALLVKELVL
jgi:hypothetical protein